MIPPTMLDKQILNKNTKQGKYPQFMHIKRGLYDRQEPTTHR